MRITLAVLMTGLLTASATAQPWYARGEFNGWSQDNPMTDQGGGHWTASITGLFENQPSNWKIACCGVDGWQTNMPSTDSRVYSNSAGEINFHLYDQETWSDGWLPNNTRRVGYDDHNLFDWEIVGSFNGWPGDAFDPNYALTDMGNGLHRGVFALDAGILDFKFRGLVPQTPTPPANGVWDTSIGNDFGNTGGNISFVVANDGDEWIFELDLPNGRFRYYTEAAPPGLVGDHNDDGIVDAADYVLWRKDPAGHGGAQGYDDWRNNFGATGGGAASWIARSPQLGDQPMVDVGGGEYDLVETGLTPGTDYEFRIARNDLSEQVPGSNVKVRADANGDIDLNFYELDGASWDDGWSPNNTHRVGYEDHDQFDWEIMGSFNGWTTPVTALADQGDGLHTGTYVIDTAGTWEFKFRQQGDWNTSIGPDFGNSGGNNLITTTNPGELWHFELDLPNGRWRAYLDGSGLDTGIVPEPASILLALMACCSACSMARRR